MYKPGLENLESVTHQEPKSDIKVSGKRKWKFLLEICIVLMLCVLLKVSSYNCSET
jgi:hypothetical protein